MVSSPSSSSCLSLTCCPGQACLSTDPKHIILSSRLSPTNWFSQYSTLEISLKDRLSFRLWVSFPFCKWNLSALVSPCKRPPQNGQLSKRLKCHVPQARLPWFSSWHWVLTLGNGDNRERAQWWPKELGTATHLQTLHRVPSSELQLRCSPTAEDIWWGNQQMSALYVCVCLSSNGVNFEIQK